MQFWRDRLYPLGLVGVVTLTGLGIWEARYPFSAIAQPVADETLGAERSQVLDIGGANFFIDGGANRGVNLFHSFQEFGVENGGSVYFLNPTGIENILSRVTGSNASNILGTLGVLGDANLFLLNPNGIVFGPNARLDVQGSFVATTADAIGFGDQGMFSAIDPQLPSQLLTVNPSAFFFSQISPAPIQAQRSVLSSFSSTPQSLILLGGDVNLDATTISSLTGRIEIGAVEQGTVGLTVNEDLFTLTFPADTIRADISLNNQAGLLVLGENGISLTANNISIANRSSLSAAAIQLPGTIGSAGDITIDATGPIVASNNSTIGGGLLVGVGESGNVIITGQSLSLVDGSGINLSSLGQGDAGNITVRVSDTILLSGQGGGLSSAIGTSVIATPDLPSAGNSGNINLQARQIRLSDGAFIGSGNPLASGNVGNIQINARDSLQLSDRSRISSSTQGQGEAGDIRVIAGNTISLTGGSRIQTDTFSAGNAGDLFIRADSRLIVDGFDENGSVSQISSAVNPSNVPVDDRRGGSIVIVSDSMSFTNGGQISSSTLGQGDAGNVFITVQDNVLFDGRSDLGFPSGIFSTVQPSAIGDGGNIDITAGSMSFTNGAQISSSTSNQGNAGDIFVDVNGSVLFDGRSDLELPSGIFSGVELGAVGNGGTINFRAGSLSISNRAQFSSTTSGRGNAGNIAIRANDQVYLLNSIIISEVSEERGIGNGGNITLTVTGGSLELRDGSALLADTENQGNAGNITVNVRDAIILVGQGPSALDLSITVPNQITSTVDFSGTAVGEGGEIRLTANQLLMRDGAFISTETFGQGGAGDLFVDIDEIQLFDGSVISSAVRRSGRGDGGDITVESQSISLNDGSRISAFVERQQRDAQGNPLQGGQGIGGTLRINAIDSITLSGTDDDGFSSGFLTLTEREASGRAGDMFITTGDLQIADGAIVVASTYNPSPGGNISINANTVNVTGGGQIVTSTRDRGNAGSIQLDITDSITISGFDSNFPDRQQRVEAFIPTSSGRFEQVSDIITNEGENSGIFANTVSASSGAGGTITLVTPSLALRNQAQISASTSGSGRAGNITIQNADRIFLDDASITTAINADASLNDPTATPGNIDLQTNQLRLTNGANITASTSGVGNAGTITVQGADSVSLDRATISTTVNLGAIGQGGDITLRTGTLNLSNRSQISAATSGTGRAGNIFVEDAERISLLSGSSISTEVGESAIGRGGNISLNSSQISIDGNRSRITASTTGQGQAGEISVDANQVALTEGGRIITSTASNRRAGSITLNVQDSVAIDGSGSGLFANTLSNSIGRGGSITLNTTNLQLTDRARISAQSEGSGAAGGVIIQARGDVSLDNRARISTESQGENAEAGNIRIDAEGNVTLRDRSTISTRSQGENAEAGNIRLTAGNTFSASDSDVTTSAENASGGDIRLVASDIRLSGNTNITTDSAVDGGNITFRANSIRTFDNSDIIATAGQQGGNIFLNADSILAFGDSDIIAAAGQVGGDITLETPVFFGEGFRLDSADADPDTLNGNDRVDINASGQVSSGNISVPDTSFVQDSLADLPENAIDTEGLIAASCVVRSQEAGGTFIITGRGGLPERPGEGRSSSYTTGEVRSIPDSSETSWQIGDPIVEPQGMYQLEDGQIVLSQECD